MDKNENKTQERAQLPTMPLEFIYADCKQQITQAVRTVASNYRLPLWMMEAILSGLIAEYRSEAYYELTVASVELNQRTREYADAKVKETEADLIAKFENGGFADGTG